LEETLIEAIASLSFAGRQCRKYLFR